ncbi:extracellular catalytic domain type 1 short-chain-length polyhydroxyalkanoate depolymerase [Paraburkholderia caballeronis]|uniref:Esterase, PHB depolymerase family n=1 Tax=Paraburkholderia caballeronis TaxID=416943 RepID=A0A1H7KW21_9BURK|nr:PHB depolymerase family esterase [Paraburkholderia caballeronis]PXW28189.1 poly(hydroxyalkanoate) depolymerase family esterase [Paraburkholderia caballeronis]PXX03555.1 poly(hydroxyalkanoate) depolymerase family esterase [Paraburkholderia caballeronis]RAK04299.1 poly(hydroxyalkanoate) depolymerase family esterase [Paraburkholderia caballeronis]SED85801.1 esterase, PHB depolymerase family [Paraburkholderia caballeronis]SEK90958.1 esterase, PHB depolymerase family [Paraburkholderia caballeron
MTKNLTGLWMGGLQRLLAVQARAARRAARKAALHPSQMADAARAVQAVADAVNHSLREGAAPQRESRVRPRAAAWAGGEWLRATHVAARTSQRAERELPYGLYLPPHAKTAGMPLVVMLHGCKQTIDQFAEGTRMNLLADQHGFAVVYPEQPDHVHSHNCWHWYDSRDQVGGGEADSVVSLVDALVAEYGFDGSRVYVAGLSAGAGLAALLAVRAPQRFAAVALHSGPVFGEAHSGIAALDVMRRGARDDPRALVARRVDMDTYPGMPAIVLQGDEDPVVAPVNGEQLVAQFLQLNRLADSASSVTEQQRDGYVMREYRRAGVDVVRWCRVEGLDHAWSGGDEAVPFHSATGPDASALIWSFFDGHRRVPAKSVRDELAERA